MIHFETIWNEGESIFKSYSELKRKDVLQNLRKNLENLSDSEDKKDYENALGDILLDLCGLCAYLEENKKMQVNSATCLTDAITRRRAQILDTPPK
jgi:hypothetical protein